jgi:uncharacterized membrane protein YgdD (TMEM256/DUF423 family)
MLVNPQNLIRIVGISGLIAVSLGALGAHYLTTKIESAQLLSFKTGVQFHIYHTLALFICGLWLKFNTQKQIKYASCFFLLGIILFSGSIYLLSLKDWIGIPNLKYLGPITPIGGFFFILGWATLIRAKF